MNYVNQTINEIRQKYVGTCYEHDLLRSLASDADSMYKRIKEDLQRDLESELGNREYHKAIYTAVTEGMSLDHEIRQWKENKSFEHDYARVRSAQVFIGKGVTSAELRELADLIDDLNATTAKALDNK